MPETNPMKKTADSSKPYRHALLLFKEHPTGRLIADLLIKNELPPICIIEEMSPVAETKRLMVESRLNSETHIPLIQDLAHQYNIPTYTVDNHNNERCYELITKYAPDLIFLGNTRVIKPPIFSLPKDGCINIHPGLLPEVKGSFPVAWAIYHDQPIGCTSHFIDSHIDTGNIIERMPLPVTRKDTIATLVEKTIMSSGELALRAAKKYYEGALTAYKQQPNPFPTYQWPPEEIIEKAEQKLQKGLFAHYSE